MVLASEQRTKIDESEDGLFYAYPRLVTHVDDSFIRQLTELYRERLQPNTRILDLMSSWVSHLPAEMSFAHVSGHGLNEAELARNPRLDDYVVQNLNRQRRLPFPDASFDAVLITVSVQYLQYPEEIFVEIHRILKAGGITIVSFSNRMFYQKAIQAWRDGSEMQRVQLVQKYLAAVPKGFSQPEIIIRANATPAWMAMFGGGTDPFYAVISHRCELD